MARLIIKSDGFGNQVLHLHLGVNRLGRSPENDFQIEHSTISAHHCELILGSGEITLRDCGSTNGTLVAGKPIKEATLVAGQTFCLGDVELFVESADVTIAIPKFDVERPSPPVVLKDGGLVCPRHPQALVTHQCTHCSEVMCDACVHRLRRRGGKVFKFCPLCSHKVEPLGGAKKKKRSLLGLLQKTVKLPFLHSSRDEPE
jgi:pSer/pThr/pTyr-binding forkhead associated (FHA) protein